MIHAKLTVVYNAQTYPLSPWLYMELPTHSQSHVFPLQKMWQFHNTCDAQTHFLNQPSFCKSPSLADDELDQN